MANSASAILVYKNKVLLVLRDNIPTITDPNTWNLPGGVIESGEDFQEGCLREIKEEANISLKKLILIDEFIWPNGTSIHKGYFAKLTDEEAASAKLGNEGQKIGFFSFEDLAKLKLSGTIKYQYNNHREVLRKILEAGMPQENIE